MIIKELKNKLLSRPLPNHIGIILDGNGRWAQKRLLPRNIGHEKGFKTLREIVYEIRDLKIKNLTIFAFSIENWSRPKEEVDYLLNRFRKFYFDGLNRLKSEKIRVKVIGLRNNIPNDILLMIEDLEVETKGFKDFTLTIAFNYGSQQEIVEACKLVANDVLNNKIKINDLNKDNFTSYLQTKELLPLDFLIRTSGELRLSNFLLYQAAYTELYFPKKLWPDFHKKDLYEAIIEYQNRKRRFGGLEK